MVCSGWIRTRSDVRKAMWGSVYLPLLEMTDSVEYWVARVSPVPSNAAARVHMGSGLLEHQRLAVGG